MRVRTSLRTVAAVGAVVAVVASVLALSTQPVASANPQSGVVQSGVVRFAVEQRRSFADGMSFGAVGPYERLDGTASMEIDPRDP